LKTTTERFREGMWRYDAIPRTPCLSRPTGYFSPDEFVAARIWQIWELARIVEICDGKPPASLILCVHPRQHPCVKETCNKDAECDHRFWADVSRACVLGVADLRRIAAGPPSPALFLGIINCDQARQLLRRIEELGAWQSRRQC